MISIKVGDDVKEIQFDLSKLTVKEYRLLFDKTTGRDYEEELICKVTGLELDDLANLSLLDYKRVFQGFIKAARDPLSDPN